MNVGPEAEFFLFKLDADGNPTVDPHDAATYFDVAPIDRGEDCRRDIEVTLAADGLRHRGGPPRGCDRPARDRLPPCRRACDRRQPDHVPGGGQTSPPATGCTPRSCPSRSTARQAPACTSTSRCPGRQERLPRRGTRSPPSSSRSAGVHSRHPRAHPGAHGGRQSAVNSYKRLVPGDQAPVYIAWCRGTARRRPHPRQRGGSARTELRTPDPTANPYLALAVNARGWPGRHQERVTPPEPVNLNIYHLTEEERELGIRSLPQTCRTRWTRSRPTT